MTAKCRRDKAHGAMQRCMRIRLRRARAEWKARRGETNDDRGNSGLASFASAAARQARQAGHLQRRCCWVVKVILPKPATRAASITLITDWWVALASALMMMTGSALLPAARFSSAASASGVVNATAARLIMYCPPADTPTLTWPGRSAGLAASAVGRLICISE